MAPLERLWLRQLRARLVPQATGRVLEIGVGTGANMPFNGTSTSITAVDESAAMLSIAARRAAVLNRRVALSQADVEHLTFPSDCFDTVIASLVLCSVVDLGHALSELWRVLRKPNGQLLLLEHMRPRARPLALLTDLANGPWLAWNGRCHLNRETQAALLASGFEIDRVEARLSGLLRLIVAHTAAGQETQALVDG
jgi:ubiquinone/menaquinone biosynthesis C-methylase UbiE